MGGGATGAAVLWALSQDPNVCGDWQATLIHDQPDLGGHSLTVPVDHNGATIQVDVGVQLISRLLYPNVAAMLGSPAFESVRLTDVDDLRVACAFPGPPAIEEPLNWGNFPEYQQGPSFGLYSQEMQADATTFQDFIEMSVAVGWGELTVGDFFRKLPVPLNDPDRFREYFVAPYLSIMNGYGSADMDQVTFGDLAPLFDRIPWAKSPLGAFTHPGTGWSRFTNGSSTWVRAMAAVAGQTLTSTVITDSTVTAVWTDTHTEGNPVHVRWTTNGETYEDVFDKVVLTTDMWTSGQLLDNPENHTLWKSVYQPRIAKSEWALLPGECYIHTDESILAPFLRERQEILQFTAAYARTTTWPYYDISKTFTTFLLDNLLADPRAEGLYLTMYGDTSTHIRKPASGTVKFRKHWTHGMWAASFLGGPKRILHEAQGRGWFSGPDQPDTNVYFAGNNTTTDSEEGALDSAMGIVNYAFRSPYPIRPVEPTAVAMFLLFYLDVMFPMTGHARREAIIRSLTPH
ncbi:FAD-dependent oxidoreductase [Actinokineospora inagensis]|uniref:FAD-dependent oxidoreductase n=1 Tax=Actinokineospora inagensis TaxID=103730 RepID=UPI00146FACFB|nr:FAD-dependent oxidoreductase [Actinokineospora inagensis]